MQVVHFQVTALQCGGSAEEALRVCRLCFVKAEGGADAEELKQHKAELLAALRAEESKEETTVETPPKKRRFRTARRRAPPPARAPLWRGWRGKRPNEAPGVRFARFGAGSREKIETRAENYKIVAESALLL